MAIGYVGNFIAPYAVYLANNLNIQPIVFIGIIGLFANFITLFATETLNTTSPLDIPEL